MLKAAGVDIPKAEDKTLEVEKTAAFVQLQRARKMLVEDLPARARSEQVPSRWLQ